MVQVPVIDLSAADDAAAKTIAQACRTVGFFHVSNHGIDAALLDEMYAQNRTVFSLPLEAKMAFLADANNRGYTPYQEETLDPSRQKQGDTKEGIYFGREIDPASAEARKPLHGPNQWPDAALVPRFKEVTLQYFDAMRALGCRLLRLLALSLQLPPCFFEPLFDPPMAILRPLHYSSTKSAPDDGIYGAGAHSDYGMLTILSTDGVPGLQIYAEDSWHDVNPLPGTLIINLGDMLERWTNGEYQSTLHRVVNKHGQERYSIAFFFEPAFDTVVECLPQCTGPDKPPKYPPTTAGQHILDKYAGTHAGYHGPTQMDGVKQHALPAPCEGNHTNAELKMIT